MAEAAAPAAAPAPAASLVLAVQRLLQDLRPDSVDEAAAIIAGTDLDVHQQADGLASEMYRAATSGPDKALAVAQLLGEVLALDPSGNGRQLRRLLLTRCEKAFDLSPPPGMSEGYKRKMGAMTFVAALFNEGVIPASVMHSCLAELLQGGDASRAHDLDCLHLLLFSVGPRLHAASADSAARVGAYCSSIRRLARNGALARAPSLAAKLLELCARHEAGWKEQAAPQPLAAPEAAAKAPPPPPPAAEGCWGSGPHADADAVPAALAAQLRMGPPAPAASAGTDGSTASAQLPPHLVQQQAPALADEWDYLAPDGISVYGPFSLEQLQFWVGQGHMAADVQVRQHSSPPAAASWHDLRAEAHALATGGRLPDAVNPALAAPPAPAQAPMPMAATAPAPSNALLRPSAPTYVPASPNGGTLLVPVALAPNFVPAGSWQSPTHVVPAAAAGIPPPPQLAPAAPPAAAPAKPAEVPDAAAWATAVHTKPSAAVPVPAAPRDRPLQQQVAALIRTGNKPGLGKDGAGGNGSKAGSPASSNRFISGGSRKKSVGYEDDKEWLVKNARGKCSGPFTGHELLGMLQNDTLAEDSMIKKADWKAYRPLEQVEDVILEMFSKKPAGGASRASLAALDRRGSDLENASGGCGGGGGGKQGSRSVSATPTAASPGSSSDWFASPTLQRPASSITQAGHAAPISPADSHASPGPAAAAASLRAPLSPALPDAPSSPADAPLPGTPAPPPQQQQQQGEEGEEAVPSPAATPVGMHTPGPAAAADVPAGGTPASVCYTPGQPALDSGLLSGFTPSPAPGAHGSLAMPSPTSSTGGFGAGGYSPQPAEAAGEAAPQPWQAPAAGGPQVSDAPKPAFAAYSAAAAAASAAAAAGGSSSS